MLSLCLRSRVSYAFKWPLVIPSILFVFFYLECWYITVNTKPERVKRLWATGRKSEQSNSRELERHCYLPVQLRPMYTYTLSLEGLGLQPKNCGSVHWMAGVFRASTVHKKQCVHAELHLRKHLGTGQGPAAEGSCHWGALSHWCASVQRPCKSSTKESRIDKDK